jgi:hypothetical protein
MAIIKSQGLQLAIGSTLGTQFTVSAVTNANPAVATFSASHGVAVNDIILLQSGWKRLNERVVRASAVATNDVTLEGINTSATADYPTGEGVGTGREITAFTTISQLQPDVGVSGGGFRRSDITQIDDIRAKEIPILAEATALTFSYFWDSELPWLGAVDAAARAGNVVPFRITIGTTKIYGAGYWGFNSVPSIQNGVLVSSIELSLVSDVTTYTT